MLISVATAAGLLLEPLDIFCPSVPYYVTRYIAFRKDAKMERANLPEFGRFAEPALLILVSLSEGPKHGYAIMSDIEAGTRRPMGPGTLYAALTRLEERGLIEPLASVDRRRPYRLTGLGATVLHEQLTELSAFAVLGLQRLAGRSG
jgi:DNA-binding PadR family transcriptional regulator